jgi:hypothetical protein
MAETRLVVEHREQLWSLLVEAAQIEHMIMCQLPVRVFQPQDRAR